MRDFKVVLFVVLFALWSMPTFAQQFQCPAGSVSVSGGGGMMCQCPDGSFADISGCRNSPQPQYQPQQPICPAGKAYCAHVNLCCGSGSVCTKFGCTPIGAVDCGNHYCNPGMQCTSTGRCMPSGNTECGNQSCPPDMFCGSKNQCMAQGVNDCGNGASCSDGKKCSRDGTHCIDRDTVDCGSHFCDAHSKCGSANSCLDSNAVDCGNGKSCWAGYLCRQGGGCATREQLAAEQTAEKERKQAAAEAARVQEAERQRAVAEKKAESQKLVNEQRKLTQLQATYKKLKAEADLQRKGRANAQSNGNCETADETLDDLANGRVPWGKLCGVNYGSSRPTQSRPTDTRQTTAQNTASALSSAGQPIKLNKDLYQASSLSAVPHPVPTNNKPNVSAAPPSAASTFRREGNSSTYNPAPLPECGTTQNNSSNGYSRAVDVALTKTNNHVHNLAVDINVADVRGAVAADTSITGVSVSASADAALIRSKTCLGQMTTTTELLTVQADAGINAGVTGVGAAGSVGAYLFKTSATIDIPVGPYKIELTGNTGAGLGAQGNLSLDALKGVQFGANIAAGIDAGLEVQLERR